MDKARIAALDLLERCRRSGAWSAEALDAAIRKYGLDTRSAALSSGIGLGVIQNTALLDFYIDSFAKGKIEPKVRDILRTAFYQILFMDRIPDTAAVNEAVEQTKALGFQRASGFVNAVLRKLTQNKDKLPEIPGKGSAAYLALRYSHPQWLAELLISERGYAFTEGFFAANNTPARTTIQVNTLKTTTSELKADFDKAGIAYTEHEWLPDCLYVSGNVTRLPGFDEGLFYVQDAAARCAVSAAGLQPGLRVLDACAAPGGKSFAAAITMQNTGEILSRDKYEKKLGLISEGAKRLGLSVIRTEAADATEPLSETFDAIIADVPCSGLGVIRKKPEIRFKTAEELVRLPDIQTAILRNLAKSVRPGGVLIYSTCTVLKAENEDVVNAFLSENGDYSAEAFTLPDGKEASNGMYTFWPQLDGTDGFFVCKIRRKL